MVGLWGGVRCWGRGVEGGWYCMLITSCSSACFLSAPSLAISASISATLSLRRFLPASPGALYSSRSRLFCSIRMRTSAFVKTCTSSFSNFAMTIPNSSAGPCWLAVIVFFCGCGSGKPNGVDVFDANAGAGVAGAGVARAGVAGAGVAGAGVAGAGVAEAVVARVAEVAVAGAGAGAAAGAWVVAVVASGGWGGGGYRSKSRSDRWRGGYRGGESSYGGGVGLGTGRWRCGIGVDLGGQVGG